MGIVTIVRVMVVVVVVVVVVVIVFLPQTSPARFESLSKQEQELAAEVQRFPKHKDEGRQRERH